MKEEEIPSIDDEGYPWGRTGFHRRFAPALSDLAMSSEAGHRKGCLLGLLLWLKTNVLVGGVWRRDPTVGVSGDYHPRMILIRRNVVTLRMGRKCEVLGGEKSQLDVGMDEWMEGTKEQAHSHSLPSFQCQGQT